MFLSQGSGAAVPPPSRNNSKAVSQPIFRSGSVTVKPKKKEHPESRLVAQVNNQHVYQNLFMGEFLGRYLPTAGNCPQVPLTWLQIVFNVPTESPALNQALAAVSLSVVGRATNNPTLVFESSRKYGQALWELQRALWNERLIYRDETLAACMALVLYEVSPLPMQHRSPQ